MSSPEKKERRWGPNDYWRAGPIFVRKRLAVLLVIALSAAILLIFGFPSRIKKAEDPQLPAYRYNDPELAGISGLVRVLDDENRVRYIGEVAAGAYTGQGKVFNESGELLYDGPLMDGVYEGAGAKVYQSGALVYTGDMAGNCYEGQGRRINPETGVVSEGQFSKNLLEGRGQEYYADGTLLREGAFSRDLLEGEGAEYSREGVLLREGVFSAGLLHGEGREYTTGGKLRYAGQFWRGIYHGDGTLYDTLLGVRSAAGTFVYGKLTGQGTIYHPSGQLLYTGQVCGDRPRADAFLGLSLAEVEAAFTSHWDLYSYEGITAFVYPYFHLMFITESPVEVVSPTQAEEAAQRERQELLDALERPAPEESPPGTEEEPGMNTEEPPENGDTATEPVPEVPPDPESQPADDAGGQATALHSAVYAAAPSNAVSALPTLYDDELLSPDTDKQSIIIIQVLSYGQPLPCVAQAELDYVSGQHRLGWREWFSDFASGELTQGVSVRQSGQFVWRFTPWLLPEEDHKLIDEFLAEYAGVETMTVRKEDKDMSLWYQTAKWRDGS